MSSAHSISDIGKAGFSPFVTVKTKQCDQSDRHWLFFPPYFGERAKRNLVKKEYSLLTVDTTYTKF